MAKKTSKKSKATPKPKRESPEPQEERASFLPGEEEEQKNKQNEQSEFPVNVEADSDLLESAKHITLTVRRGEDRRLEVELCVPPLSPWVERAIWPMPETAPEHLAGIIAGTIERAAHTVAHDAAVQYARRINEEAEAKERYARRG